MQKRPQEHVSAHNMLSERCWLWIMHQWVISIVAFLWVIRNKMRRDSIWPPLFLTTFAFHSEAFYFLRGLIHCQCIVVCSTLGMPLYWFAIAESFSCWILFVWVLMLWARAYWFSTKHFLVSGATPYFYHVSSRFYSTQRYFIMPTDCEISEISEAQHIDMDRLKLGMTSVLMYFSCTIYYLLLCCVMT